MKHRSNFDSYIPLTSIFFFLTQVTVTTTIVNTITTMVMNTSAATPLPTYTTMPLGISEEVSAWSRIMLCYCVHDNRHDYKPFCSRSALVLGTIPSQMEPLNPGVHVHSNISGELLHVPPLRQGFERHMFISISQLLPCVYVLIKYYMFALCLILLTVIPQILLNRCIDNHCSQYCI